MMLSVNRIMQAFFAQTLLVEKCGKGPEGTEEFLTEKSTERTQNGCIRTRTPRRIMFGRLSVAMCNGSGSIDNPQRATATTTRTRCPLHVIYPSHCTTAAILKVQVLQSVPYSMMSKELGSDVFKDDGWVRGWLHKGRHVLMVNRAAGSCCKRCIHCRLREA